MLPLCILMGRFSPFYQEANKANAWATQDQTILDLDHLPDDPVHASRLGREDLRALKPDTILPVDAMLCYC
jgi:hypothetical protein